MRKLLSTITILSMLITIGTTSVYAESEQNSMAGSLKHASEAFDQSIEEIIDTKKAKGAVATFIQNGEVAIMKGYGYADEAISVEASGEETGFRIGSISKTFVAVAALKAMQDGKLDMNKDISTYLGKDYPRLKYPVTMQDLLTHTAGFEEKITGMAVKNISDTEPLSKTIMKYMPEQIFRPGEVSSYSNYGIALAAYVIEHVTNEDFAEYCMNNIFLPLGMKSTTFAYTHDTVYVSKAYLPDGNETMDLYMNLYPEGSAVSTAEDMGKYIQFLLGKKDGILLNENREKLFTRQYFMADELAGIGYVWNRKIRNNSLYVEKKGETLHFYSRIVLYPRYKTGFFLSFNTYVSEEEINKITAQVTDLVLGEKDTPIPRSGESLEISGCYANAWSSFQTAEKLLRYIVPGKMVDISGSLKEGYTFNDKKITHIGNNSYDTPIGIVKFIEKNGEILMATNFSQTYIRINGLENKGVTILVILLFFISVLYCTASSFISRLRRKSTSLLYGIMGLVQIIIFFALGYILYLGILNYGILSYTIYINIAAWLMVFTTIANIFFTVRAHKKTKDYFKYIYFHNMISIIFSLMMFNFNLLI